MSLVSPESQSYGNTGLSRDEALTAGINLAIDALKFRPRNVAGLDTDQLRSVTDAILTAEADGGEGAHDVFRALGATQLRHI